MECAHRQGYIGCCLPASAWRHCRTAGSISLDLNAFDVACAHLASDVGQRHASSDKACTYQPWRVRIDWASTAVARTDQPTTGDIGQGLHEIPWCVRI